MSKKLYEESNIQAIASAIRAKNGTQNTYTTGQMAEAVRAIITPPSLEEKTATRNGIILPDAGYDGLSKVTVNVSGGDATGIVSPSYQGVSCCYMTSDGASFYRDTSMSQYINIFEVHAYHTYILAVGQIAATRRRAGFFPGRAYSQFEPYIFEPANQELIFSDGIWLAPDVLGTDDSGSALMERIICSTWANGVIVYGTDNTGANCPAYCIDVHSFDSNTVMHIATHSVGGSDASMSIQLGHWDNDQNVFIADSEPEIVIYSSVTSNKPKNCYGLASLAYGSGSWHFKALTDITDGTNVYSKNQEAACWQYRVNKDLYIQHYEIT